MLLTPSFSFYRYIFLVTYIYTHHTHICLYATVTYFISLFVYFILKLKIAGPLCMYTLPFKHDHILLLFFFPLLYPFGLYLFLSLIILSQAHYLLYCFIVCTERACMPECPEKGNQSHNHDRSLPPPLNYIPS